MFTMCTTRLSGYCFEPTLTYFKRRFYLFDFHHSIQSDTQKNVSVLHWQPELQQRAEATQTNSTNAITSYYFVFSFSLATSTSRTSHTHTHPYPIAIHTIFVVRRCILSESVVWLLFCVTLLQKYIYLCCAGALCVMLLAGSPARSLALVPALVRNSHIKLYAIFRLKTVFVPTSCSPIFHVHAALLLVCYAIPWNQVKTCTNHSWPCWHRWLHKCNEYEYIWGNKKKESESIDMAWEYGNRIVSIAIARAFFRLPFASSFFFVRCSSSIF